MHLSGSIKDSIFPNTKNEFTLWMQKKKNQQKIKKKQNPQKIQLPHKITPLKQLGQWH